MILKYNQANKVDKKKKAKKAQVHDKYLCVFWSGSVTLLIPDDVKKLSVEKNLYHVGTGTSVRCNWYHKGSNSSFSFKNF